VTGNDWVTVALPKGRLLEPTEALLARAGLEVAAGLGDRTMLAEDPARRVRAVLARPADVPTYVEEGAADLGVVGKDVLMEQEPAILEVLDLGVGACRMVLAAPLATAGEKASPDTARWLPSAGRGLRVATCYPRVTEAYLRRRGLPGAVIRLSGNVELAPRAGLADAVVDLVATGRTLAANGLVEVEEIAAVTARLVANPVSFRLKHGRLAPLVQALRQAAAAGRKEKRRALA